MLPMGCWSVPLPLGSLVRLKRIGWESSSSPAIFKPLAALPMWASQYESRQLPEAPPSAPLSELMTPFSAEDMELIIEDRTVLPQRHTYSHTSY